MSNESLDRARNSSLSAAADEALREYLQMERERVLSEATRLHSGGLLSSFDIVNAIEALEARDRSVSRPEFHRSRSREIRSLLLGASILALVLALTLSSALFLILNETRTEEAATSSTLMNVVLGGVTALTAAIAAFSISAALRTVRSRSERKAGRDFIAVYEHVNEDSHLHRIDERNRIFITLQGRSSDEKAAGQFIVRWVSLERELRELGSKALGIPSEDARRYPIGELLRLLRRDGSLDNESYELTRSALRLRNMILHDGHVDSADVEAGLQDVARLSSALNSLS